MTDPLSTMSYRGSVADTIIRSFSPWTRMPPEEWAEFIYRLPNGARFKWSYAPYARQIFRSYFDRHVIETDLEIFSRGLKSTTILLLIGYAIDQAPRRVLCLWPTNQQGEKWSKDVFTGELCDTTDCLAFLGTAAKKRDGTNTLLHKNFPGGLIDIFGANAPGDMRRAKGSLLCADEIDAITETQTDEGDQLAIFSKRGDEYPDTIRVFASYPALKLLDNEGKPKVGHSRIDAKMLETDGNQWFSTCLLCGGEPYVMHRAQLRYEDGKTAEARLECPRCHGLLTDAQRHQMAHGQGFDNWRPLREFRGRRGFHAGSMLWPHPVDFVKYPGGYLQVLAEKVIAAEKSDNPARSMRVIVNTEDAEPFNPDLSTEEPPDYRLIMARLEDYATPEGKITLPAGALVLTCGIDAHPDRLEVFREAWGREEESWAVEHVIIPGDIKDSGTWEALERELLREYAHEGGGKVGLSFGLIDCGHGAEHILWFLSWLRKKSSPLAGKIRACKGSSQFPHPIVDYRFSRLAKQLKGHWVGGDEAKDLIYRRLKLPTPGQNYRHYGKNMLERFFVQLTVEKATVDGDERRYKNAEHQRNEALDCFDSETEVLTSDGWMPFSALTKEIQIATVNLKSDRIEYQRPVALIAKRYAGKMVHIHGKRIDVLVTPNHRMVTYKKEQRTISKGVRRWNFDVKPKITLAKNLTIHHSLKMGAQWEGFPINRVLIPESRNKFGNVIEPERMVDARDMAALVGWYVSEGYRMDNVSKTQRNRRRKIGICQIKEDGIAKIAALIDRLPWRFHYAGKAFICCSVQLHAFLAEAGDGCLNKRAPQWIKDAQPSVISAFLDAAIAGDGWVMRTGENQRWFRTYSTISAKLGDDMQELFLKTGKASSLKIIAPRRPKPGGIVNPWADIKVQYHITEIHHIKAALDGGGNGKREFIGKQVDYDGMVYCATVPNGTLICRRNGRTFVAGNCSVYSFAAFRLRKWNYDAIEAELAPPDEKPKEEPKAPEPVRNAFVGASPGWRI